MRVRWKRDHWAISVAQAYGRCCWYKLTVVPLVETDYADAFARLQGSTAPHLFSRGEGFADFGAITALQALKFL